MATVSTTPTTLATGFAASVVTPNAGILTTPSVPRLEQGDRLTSAEFERRYEAMADVKKAELIEGTVYMPSSVRFPEHGKPHWLLVGWLYAYEANTPGVTGADNTTVKLDNDNMPQPDALLMIKPESGVQATIDSSGYINGAPELVAEIASSSVSIDLHSKLNVYRRSGVREYIVWRVLDWSIDWFILRDGQYAPISPGDDGILRSVLFPGLWLNVPAILNVKLDAVEATLQQGIATPEHNDFVARLAVDRKV